MSNVIMPHACRVCGIEFVPTESQIRRRARVCKSCKAAASRQWRAANPERAKATNKKWRAANAERAKVANKKWQAAHPGRAKAVSRQWRAEHPNYDRDWRIAHPEQARAVVRKYKMNNKDKIFAQTAVSHAVKNGTLIRLPCENCGRGKPEGHHEDYSQPLVVTWLCPRCHSRLHAHKREAASQRETAKSEEPSKT